VNYLAPLLVLGIYGLARYGRRRRVQPLVAPSRAAAVAREA
jgi:hypothetical protein